MSPSNAHEIASPPPPAMIRFLLPIWSLAQREVVRFLRQRTRIVGALGQPLILWILFGTGLHGSFAAPAWLPSGTSYQEYFFPGTAVLILLFTAIFSTISIIEDRREGFLQAVLAAPVSRWSLVLGKLSGGTVLAVGQAAVFLALGPLANLAGLAPALHVDWSFGPILSSLAFLVLLGFTLTGLGYVIAWPLDSTQGFHAIMSVVLLPMWLLSGAFFPAEDAGWLAWVIRLNPLTYGVAGLRHTLYPHQSSPATSATASGGLPGFALCLVVTSVFCMICVAASVWLTGRRTTQNTR